MLRTRKLAGAALAAALAVGGLTAGSAAASAAPPPQTCGGTPAVTTNTGSLPDGATYKIQCPAGAWNGMLFLYSHGYVVPGSANPAEDVGDPLTGQWLLANGFALAGSSYATTGWAIQSALSDQLSTLNLFDQTYGKPRTTIAWGHSLGGIITAGLIQDYPNLFNAALPMCGVLSGGVATWNTALDAEFAFKTLLAPTSPLQLVNIKNPTGNLGLAEQILGAAQQTPQGVARLALVSALADTPGWYTTGSPEPAPTDYVDQEANQFQWAENVTFPFVFDFRSDLEQKAGGNPSWNTGVNYFADLAKSADLKEVVALYRAAGLSLTKDLQTLNSAQRVSADPSAVAYLAKYIAFNGDISIPVLTMHTTGDGLVVPENEQAYRSVVDRDGNGNGNLLRQIFVSRAGHCAFTPAETITAVKTLLNRLSTGHWNVPSPAGLNSEAAALGSTYNTLTGTSTVTPAFTTYFPTPYLRPFDLAPFFGGPAQVVP
jgi:pimeloyl-ACP methyl ester carboxylesterase